MVQTVFPKSIVFFVSFGFENFYEFFRMPIFHAHAKLKHQIYVLLVNVWLRIFWAFRQETCKAWA